MKNRILQKMTNTLRGRLTLWYIVSVGLIVLLLLVSVSGLFWVTLQDQIDHHVHIAVSEAKQVVENYRGEERDSLIKNLVSAKGMTVVVLSPDGSAILETNSPDIALVTEHQLQKLLGSSSLYDLAPIHFTENNIRFAAMPAQVSAGKGIVAVGYSTQVLYGTLYKLVAVVLGVVFFLVLPIAFLGYKLLKKQLHPLESIATQAKAVTDTTSLSKRIAITTATAELRTIQDALNAMLTQLENIFTNEREFFSDAAHTLKTPLAVLRSQAENANLTQKVREDMLKTIDKANETISDLLFLSRIAGKPQKSEAVSISSIMTDLAELATTLGEDKGLTITTDIQPDIILKADKKLLQRALSNIVYNAVFYNKPQGSIHLSLKKNNDSTIISVKDTGIGVSKNDMPQLFTRFFRGANAENQGSGLGLAISKAVVENMGGKVTLTSALDKGTTVSATFS
jgi:signal transduction histidine kinase